MKLVEHEAAAYIAGAIFATEAMLAMKGNPGRVRTDTMHSIERAAWNIALLEIEDRSVPKELYDALDLAIRTSPQYKDKADDIVDNDGVGRTWKVRRASK